MTVDEKAKCYDEAIKKAEALYKAAEPMSGCNVIIETVFPELKESEDEKIRKNLIGYIKGISKNEVCEETKDSWIAWLEKQGETSPILSNSSNIGKDAWSEEEQNRFAKGVLTSCAMSFIDYLDAHKYEGKMCVSNGECEDIENAFHNAMWDRLHRYYCKYIEKQGEQKPADKAEPKFKVGDFIVDYYCRGRVVELTDDAYMLDTEQGIPFSCEHNAHLWTIKDAKDGDVLVSSYSQPFLFKEVVCDEFGKVCCAYGGIDGSIKFIANTHEKKFWTDSEGVEIATKEQRDALMKAMTDAGYTFDFEKKELKKIEQKPAWSEEDESYLNTTIAYLKDAKEFKKTAENCINWLKSLKPQPKWSKEDEKMIKTVIANIKAICKEGYYIGDVNSNELVYPEQLFNWLKSLKDRIQPQPKQKWSEEDEKILNSLISSLARIGASTRTDSTSINYTFSKEIDWLKSLRPQNKWKPSEEQIGVIEAVINNRSFQKRHLDSLYEQLKKLKEE